jgi:hypothetical protein
MATYFDTRTNFSGPVQGRARVDAPNWSNTNMAPQPYDLRIHDARPIIDTRLREPYDEPGNSFESQFAMFNPAQRWYYFSDLTPDELIVFKGFDSDPARSAQPPHNSADLPGEGAAPRVSVEARFFAFFC